MGRDNDHVLHECNSQIFYNNELCVFQNHTRKAMRRRIKEELELGPLWLIIL